MLTLDAYYFGLLLLRSPFTSIFFYFDLLLLRYHFAWVSFSGEVTTPQPLRPMVDIVPCLRSLPSLYPIDVIWSRYSEHPGLWSGVDGNLWVGPMRMGGPATGNPFSLLHLVLLIANIFVYN